MGFSITPANAKNPGPWYEHSLNVGKAAYIIASECPKLNNDAAYAMGALHDIGRREGVTQMHHVIAGYDFMMQEGFPEIAKVCITHSFITGNIKDDCAQPDCTEKEIDFIKNFLDKNPFTDYDKLIQLCDCICLPYGFCLLEKRLVDVVLRYGFNEGTLNRWKETFKIKQYFENKTGKSIYSNLPDVEKTTFGTKL